MKKGDLFPIASESSMMNILHKNKMIQYTGEKRYPVKGEWYLSGAIIEGYYAFCDMFTEYHICKLVKIRKRTIIEVIK